MTFILTMRWIGTCTGVVVNIGDYTVMGRIARLAGSIVEESEDVEIES